MKIKITQAVVEKAELPADGKSTLHADTELRGFYLIVSPTKKAFYVQSLVNGRQVRVKLGDFPALTAKAARELAAKTLVSMRSGVNPSQERRKAKVRGITLREAVDLHLAARERTPRTTESYKYQVDQYLSDWLDRPLAELTRAEVRDRHRKLSERSGPTTADYTMRVLRAVYNRALRQHPELPSNPTANVDFHGVKRREVLAEPQGLTAWGCAVLAIENDIRRDLHLFMLLSGMRRTAAVEARIEHLDLGRCCLRVPNPKGGAARAFDLPLSAPLLDLCRHRAQTNHVLYRGSPWLFPADSRTGRVAEVKEPSLEFTGHALRHLYASLALEAGVPFAELKMLLNHSHHGLGVTGTYLRPSLDHLRGWQEKASARILEAIGVSWHVGTWPPVVAEDARGELPETVRQLRSIAA